MHYANGGTLFSDTVVIYVTKSPKLMVNAPAPVCLPQTIDLSTTYADTANTTGTVTYWKDSMCTIASGNVVSASGDYFIKKTTSTNSCVALKKVTVSIFPAVVAPDIAQSGNVLSSTLGVGNQWYSVVGGPITGATDSLYSPTQNGSYYVVYHHPNCGDFYSDTISFVFNGLEETETNLSTSIFPNPATNQFIISSEVEWNSIQVENVNGQLVFENNYTDKITINTSEWARGLYVVKFMKDNQFLRRKLVIE
jgi:hypothetical protein